jgi:hypothetical protein
MRIWQTDGFAVEILNFGVSSVICCSYCIIDLTYQINGSKVCNLFLSSPNYDCIGSFVDIEHESNLFCLLLWVRLVDAYSIDPYIAASKAC